MGPAWAQAFLTACLITLLGTPLLRRLAVATDFVDHPLADHKSHTDSTPYLGGIGLIVAVLASLLYTSRITPSVVVIAMGGAAVGCLGLLDDHRSVGALPRFGLEVVVAAVALAAGLRVHATDILAVDGLLTIIWIVGVTNAINLLDNMDGLATGVAAAAAGAIFALAVLNEEPVAAVLAAGLAGACLGFGVYNKRPASIFMGDAGSLFLGFVLAVVAMDVSPSLTPPTSFVVPVMLLALPVLDTATVTICRLRRRRSVAMGGKDHLSHRLVARGLGPGAAVGILIAVEAWVGLLAVLTGRRVISLPLSVAATGVTFAALVAVTVRADVYIEPVVGMPRRLRVLAAGAVAVGFLLTAPAVFALLRARGPGTAGALWTSEALNAVSAGDRQRATELLKRADGDLEQADTALHGPFSSLGLLVPGLRANLATMRALVETGRDIVAAAQEVTAIAEASTVPLRGDQAIARTSQALAPALSDAAFLLQRSSASLAGYNRPYLWPPLAETVRALQGQLEAAATASSRAADLTRVLPGLLGDAGTRRYFLAVQDNTELRGSGGVFHYWGELVAEGGRLRLDRLAPTSELDRPDGPAGVPQDIIDRYRNFDVAGTWQNTNVSPDFQVTGKVITSLYARSVGTMLDGVIAVDLPGLAALLGATGPVRVDGRPGVIDSGTLIDYLVRDAGVIGAEEDTAPAGAVRATVEAFTSADLGTPAALARIIGPALRDGHLRFYATRADEQAVLRRLGAAGEVPVAAGDSLLVVNQNLSASSVDSHLHRSIRYEMNLDPGEREATLSGRVDVTLRNGLTAPGGENRSYLSVYTPLTLTGSNLDGSAPGVDAGVEFGRRVYSAIVNVPHQQSRTVGLELSGKVALRADGWYLLDVLHQPSLQRDDVTIALSVPDGWRIVEAQGLGIVDANHAVAELRVGGNEQVALRLERTPWARLWIDPDD
jgi:UDP-GlcNAc:undecaprenyl-phosphate GlcNAc-1-phosphate transferase